MDMPCNTRVAIKNLQDSEIEVFHCFSLYLLYSFLFRLSFLHKEESGYLTNHTCKGWGDIETGISPTGEFRRKGLCLAYLNRLSPISNCWREGKCDTVQFIIWLPGKSFSNTY